MMRTTVNHATAALTALAVLLAAGASFAPNAFAGSDAADGWGLNQSGQLGNGTMSEYALPGAISNLGGVRALAGGNVHTLALTGSGAVLEWGDGPYGQLGTHAPTAVPVAVSGLGTVAAISAGTLDSFVVLSDGAVKGWGINDVGELGNGTTGPEECIFGTPCSKVPAEVSGLSGVTAVAAGFDHTLALKSDGTVVAWGSNLYGQLGDGTTSDRHSPVAVTGLSGVVAIAAGDKFSLALLSDGTVKAWGYNGYGQLGDGTTTYKDEPVAVSGLSGAKAIAAGSDGDFALALLNDGSVRSWGENGFGELGDGTTETRKLPVAAGGLRSVTALAAGNRHAMALLSDGTVAAWGSDEDHQLGDESTTKRTAPTAVAGVMGISGIAAGGYDSFAFTTPAPPEFGRCVKLAKGVTGAYATASCTSLATAEKFSYEWEQGPPPKARFSWKLKEGTTAAIETVGKRKVACRAETAIGSYTGLRTIGAMVVRFSGCELLGQPCNTSGAASGEIVTSTLSGELGWESKALKHVALDLRPATEGEAFLTFICGGTPVVVNGSVLAKVPAGKTTSTATLKYIAKAGKQKPEHFEGGVPDVLESSLSGGAFEETGLSLTTLQASEEKIEVNWFA
jgi:alpha-tubulin suppressor-like RCC1 family protein